MKLLRLVNEDMKKYIIFDFDGTVIYTDEVIIASWQATYEKYLGYRETVENIRETFGETLRHTVEERFPNCPVDEVIAYYREYQQAHCAELVEIFDGIEDMLKSLKEHGYKLAIATSRTKEGTLNYLQQFGITEYFDAVVSMDDVTKHKPDPESCLVAIEKLGGTPEESVMLGDTKYDMGCANNAGVDSILIGWNKLVDLEKVRESGFVPKYYVEKPEDLCDMLKSM